LQGRLIALLRAAATSASDNPTKNGLILHALPSARFTSYANHIIQKPQGQRYGNDPMEKK
jgi:hypothetical protein